MAKRNPNKKWYNWCDFGEHYILDGNPHRHVYPIPVCDAYPDGGWNGEGGTCCMDHYPAIRKLQIKQGIMLLEPRG